MKDIWRNFVVLKQLRQDSVTKNHLILLTSEQIDSNPPYASELGANDYLTKLIKIEQLIQASTLNLNN